MIVIPSLELLAGRVVAPDDDGVVLAADPLAAARALCDDGALFFHLVDLDAIRGSGDNVDVVRRFADAGLSCQVAGGIRDFDRAAHVLEAGADRVVVGSMLHERPDDARRVIDSFGTRAMAAVDVDGDTAAVRGGAGGSLESTLAHVAGVGFPRVLISSFAGGVPRTGVDLAALQTALGHGGLEVHANVAVDGRGELRSLRPAIDAGLAGVVLAGACRVLEVSVG